MRVLEKGEAITVGAMTMRIGRAVGPDGIPIALFPVVCDEMPDWLYIAKTPEEAQALVYGMTLGHDGLSMTGRVQ